MHGGGYQDGARQSRTLIQPSVEEVRAQLERLVASPDLDLPTRVRKFLRYIVEETLAGRADRIKAYAVGVEVFDRGAGFDAQSDPVVRIEAGRLRRGLDQYYLAAGRDDSVVIEVPKGAYVPRFRARETAVAVPQPPAPAAVAAAHQARPPLGRKGFWPVAALLALAIAGMAWWDYPGPQPKPAVAAAEPAPPRGPTLLVMPFADLGDTPEARKYALGLTEEILGQLARFKELTILGRETARGIPPDADVSRIRRELGVRYVLEGSLRTDAHRLRVAARLLDASSGAVLWSESYDDDLRGRAFFAIQDDVAQKVATSVGQPYGAIARDDERRVKAGPPDDMEAYGCTLQFYAYRAALSTASHAAIRTCLEGAVVKYPGYATAWAMLSIVFLDEDRFGFNPALATPTAAQRAMDAARRANRLDPDNVRGLQAMMTALFFTQQPNEALQVGERAVALNPNDTELLAEFGVRVGQAGDRKRGMALLEQALARNPAHSSFYNGSLAQLAYLERDFQRAEILMRQVMMENFPIYHFVAAVIHAQLGMERQAAEARDRFMQMRPNFFDNWDQEVAKRNYGPQDAALLAEGARKAGFPLPRRTAAEERAPTTAPLR